MERGISISLDERGDLLRENVHLWGSKKCLSLHLEPRKMFSHKGDTFIYTLALFYTMSVFHLLKSCEINTTDFFPP